MQDEPQTLELLLREWSSAGSQVRLTHSARCVVHRCRTMAYIALKLDAETKSVCLKHFEILDRLNNRVA
jgi:hypothetical protein